MKKILIFVSLFFVMFFVATIQANESVFETGSVSLKTGDLNRALASYKQAVAENPQNKEYAREFMILRQVVAMQSQLDRESNAARWNANAQRLRTYYEQKGIDSQLLDLDRKIYAKNPSGENAALLAESMLENGKAAEAVDLLSRLPEKSSLARVVLGLAYLRNDNKNESQKTAALISAKETTNPVRLRLARLEAGLGEKDKAVSTLKTLLEQTPPSRQETIREQFRSATEFASLQSDAAFAEALLTPSKIAESACSGGSSCGSCPMRSKCQGR